ncbi:TerC/Alx family metal homeostasis membrane protein [Roseomonas sp. M0104]|uniref:TerC/Alx family metal homeostasis membrane protein n=1 Tax=Teichococcus coralli TaxID=2545983 RepID=A0A845B7J5_9PROT|nr:TerC/Alx family metal homeostasis membrane protein [Pseudoroseomonas coralli]MXP62220.1 TerC/Alx family metal homeostasis membrane protein [Pseudoroseomonas coralli]
MEASPVFWLVFNAAVLGLLLLDLGVFAKKEANGDPAPVPVRTALIKSAAYVGLALAFFAWLRLSYGSTSDERSAKSLEFLTGYLIEWSLSVDNIFVFVLLFAKFGVPPAYQHRVLFWGILGALLMRGVMILVGTALLREFDWLMVVFGLFLIWSGWKMLRSVEQETDPTTNPVLLWLRRHLPVTDGFRGNAFTVREAGRLMVTPLLLVLVLVELTDLLFALDSIPAIFAVSTDPFIVYTANVFAILGLRAMYFALAGIIHRFKYLKHGLSLVLMIVGAKMLANWYAGGKAVPVEYALMVTGGIIAGSIALSLWKTRGEEAGVTPAK